MVTVASFAAGLLVYAPWLIALLAIRPPAGLHRRGAFQCAELFAQLCPHTGATRARLRPADRRERGNSKGSEDLRPERLPDRTLSCPGHEFLRRKSPDRAATRGLGKPVAIGTIAYYVAYAYIVWRTLHGEFSIGDLTFLAGSFRRLRNLLENLLMGFSQVAGQALYLDDLFSFFEIQPEIVSPPNPRPFPLPIRGVSRSRTWGFAILVPSAGQCVD